MADAAQMVLKVVLAAKEASNMPKEGGMASKEAANKDMPADEPPRRYFASKEGAHK